MSKDRSGYQKQSILQLWSVYPSQEELYQYRNCCIFKNHCNDICSTTGWTNIKQNRRSECRKSYCKAKFQHSLVGQWMIHRTYSFQGRKSNWQEDTAIRCFGSKFFSQYNKSLNISSNIFTIKEKSLAEMDVLSATRTARPVIPPNVKLFVNLKKYVPTAMIRVLTVSSKKCLIFSFIIYMIPPYISSESL